MIKQYYDNSKLKLEEHSLNGLLNDNIKKYYDNDNLKGLLNGNVKEFYKW